MSSAERPNWSEGSCQQLDPETAGNTFVPEQYNHTLMAVRMAKRICANCVIRKDCLQYALDTDEEYGIYGGKTPLERKKMKAWGMEDAV